MALLFIANYIFVLEIDLVYYIIGSKTMTENISFILTLCALFLGRFGISQLKKFLISRQVWEIAMVTLQPRGKLKIYDNNFFH